MRKGKCLQSETALHTHDSICFKRCRRKWFFSSAFSMHLQPKPQFHGVNPNLWFGSGFHWAMEDFYGMNRFKSPVKAFEAYVDSFKPEELPDSVDTLVPLGIEMLSYYESWEASVRKWKVVIKDKKPLVEVPFSLVLEECSYYEYEGDRYFLKDTFNEKEKSYQGASTGELLLASDLQALDAKYHEVVFHGKLDAIVEDSHGDWWVLDYKTAKVIDTAKLGLDPQISRYCWAAEQYLEHEIQGMIYVQVSKNPPKAPKLTSKGVSTDKRQRTTRALYKQTLIDMYGAVAAAPEANIDFLNTLAEQETENGNAFVRVDYVVRNEEMKLSTYQHIIDEGKDMLHPDMKIYPNPNKDCSWDCPFKDMCLAMEEGADWKIYLDEFEVRNETMKDEVPKWEVRMYHKYPELFPEEYAKYQAVSIDTVDDFMNKYGEED